MRRQYKVQCFDAMGIEVWQGFSRLCWPLPWVFVEDSTARTQREAADVCRSHAGAPAPRQVVPLGRLPRAPYEEPFI